MKVLFVSSGNSEKGIGAVVRVQGESLKNNGVDLHYFTIVGKGFGGYIRNIPKLRHFIKKNSFDVIHAHYSFSAFTASLTFKGPLVVSLMGSDVQANFLWKTVIRLFAFFSWKKIIVKSQGMKDHLGMKHALVIPNGVDMEEFRPLSLEEARKKVGFDPAVKNIIFVANPGRYEKNFPLAQAAVKQLGESVKLHAVYNVDHHLVPFYMNAADVLLLTSVWEGSPNAVKEAMACNCPVVSTDIGDVRELISKTEGCYLASFDPDDVAAKLRAALDFKGRTRGREDIRHLEINTVAGRIIDIYREVTSKTKRMN